MNYQLPITLRVSPYALRARNTNRYAHEPLTGDAPLTTLATSRQQSLQRLCTPATRCRLPITNYISILNQFDPIFAVSFL